MGTAKTQIDEIASRVFEAVSGYVARAILPVANKTAELEARIAGLSKWMYC